MESRDGHAWVCIHLCTKTHETVRSNHSSPEQKPPKGREEEHREHGRTRVRLGLAAADAADAGLGTQGVRLKPAAARQVGARSPLPLEKRLVLHDQTLFKIGFAGLVSLSQGRGFNTGHTTGSPPAGSRWWCLSCCCAELSFRLSVQAMFFYAGRAIFEQSGPKAAGVACCRRNHGLTFDAHPPRKPQWKRSAAKHRAWVVSGFAGVRVRDLC